MIFLIVFLTIVLILLCALVTLVILMQRPSANAGMGSALGGGAAESAFGGETSKVLRNWTIYGTVAFFVLSFALYLMWMARVPSAEADMPSEGQMVGSPAIEIDATTGDVAPTAPQTHGATEAAPQEPAATTEEPTPTE